jgi:mono/diheme cytochrome c family protein
MDRGWMPLALGLLTIAIAAGSPAAARAAGDAANGKTLFMANCVSCHGASGKGDGPVGQALNPPPRDFTKGEFKFDANGDGKPGEDADLVLVVTNGAAAYGGSPLMAPWGPQLPKSDIEDLVAYVRTLKQ